MYLIFRTVGSEYETILSKQLDEKKISYLDEKKLRLLGYDKTPDFKLDIPIGNSACFASRCRIACSIEVNADFIFFTGIEGRVVNWIESKATFGDEDTHKNYLNEQLTCYFNR